MKAVVVGAFDDAALAALEGECDVTCISGITLDAVAPAIRDAEILVTRRLPVNAALFDAAPRLRLIVKLGSGLDEIDRDEAARRGIAVFNTPGVNAPAVAELAVGLLGSLVRKIHEHHVQLHATRRWSREQGTELYGKTLGVVGVGHIGSRVARLGRALEMTVVGCDPYIDPASVPIPLVPYGELLARADIVSFHVPLTEETRRMLDARALALVRPGGFVINTSRGEIADESAVLAALDSGRLAGYAADVLSDELPDMMITSPLLDHPRVLLTPHLGAWTADTNRRVCAAAVAVIRQWIATA
jgi:phosphoglycerate dehydrogenase-like enzyme